MPWSRQACAASRVVGNSARRTPSAALSATCPAVVSSWLASTAPSAPAAATAARRFSSPCRALIAPSRSTSAAKAASLRPFRPCSYSFSLPMSRNCRCPGVWSIRLTSRTPSPGPKAASSSTSVSEHISARRCRAWLIRVSPDSAAISRESARA